MSPKSPRTPKVAAEIGIPYHVLIQMMRSRRFPAPDKDESGYYAWTPADVERARQAWATIRAARETLRSPAYREVV